MSRVPKSADVLTITTAAARRLLMSAQGLLDDPSSQANSPSTLLKLIERMGFVQIDTINVVGRAHDLILATRSDAYRPAWLDALAGRRQKLFEHWTHDASFIPTRWFEHWRPRFARYASSAWHRRQMGDAEADALVARVIERVRAEGPLRSADFEHASDARAGAWWDWKPHKAALDFLWRTGRLHVVGRHNFQKVYDVPERAAAALHARPDVTDDEHLAWACVTALERLGVATATEVAHFWNAVPIARARAWLHEAVRRGEVTIVRIVGDGAERLVYALPDVRRRVRRSGDAPSRGRLLCPFDPVLRDRARLARLFNFDYRFEAFVPAAKRVHGYYVMPVLRGERLVGRADPKFHRDAGVLRVSRVRWEQGVTPDRALRREFEDACERLARFVGADRIEIEPPARPL